MSSIASERLILVVTACLTLGCATLKLPLSDKFLVVEEAPEIFRAITADEARVIYRAFEEQGGDLDFWTTALKRTLVDGRGYVLIEDKPATSARLGAGREFLFETTVNGRTVRYLLVLFVEKKREKSEIHVVELVADKDVFVAHLPDVRAAVAKL